MLKSPHLFDHALALANPPFISAPLLRLLEVQLALLASLSRIFGRMLPIFRLLTLGTRLLTSSAIGMVTSDANIPHQRAGIWESARAAGP